MTHDPPLLLTLPDPKPGWGPVDCPELFRAATASVGVRTLVRAVQVSKRAGG